MTKTFKQIVNETIKKINSESGRNLKLSKHSETFKYALRITDGEVFDMENIYSAKAFMYSIMQTREAMYDKCMIALFGIAPRDCHDMNILAEVYNYYYDLFFAEKTENAKSA